MNRNNHDSRAVSRAAELRLQAASLRNTWYMVVLILSLSGVTRAACGGDWPQILGPNRNGTANGETLFTTWPVGGPKLLWERAVGDGLAGVAVVKNTTVLFHRIGNEAVAEAIDVRSGSTLWKTPFDTNYRSGMVADQGPRCVPLIDKELVILHDASGDLHCVSLKDGAKKWSRKLAREYKSPEGYFGAGSTPIVFNDMVILNVGGRSGAAIVAVDRLSGVTKWKCLDDRASYSSPVAVRLDDQDRLVFLSRLKLSLIDPNAGKVAFEMAFGADGPTVTGANPLILDEDNIFVSASYGVGALYGSLSSKGVQVQWKSDDVMSCQYATCVASQGLLFGIDGRDDFGQGRLKCFDPVSQKVLWTNEEFGMAHLILAGNKIVAQKVSGEIVVFAANTRKYVEIARSTVLGKESRALPALSNGRLFVRDKKQLKCLSVGESR